MENQYFPLTACPSLLFISSQVSAGSSWIEPRGTERLKNNSLLSVCLYPSIVFSLCLWRYLTKFYTGPEVPPRGPTPYPFLQYFWQEKYPVCTNVRTTVKSHVKALGLYNFIKGFGWAYKGGRVGISGKKCPDGIKHIWTEWKQTFHYKFITINGECISQTSIKHLNNWNGTGQKSKNFQKWSSFYFTCTIS